MSFFWANKEENADLVKYQGKIGLISTNPNFFLLQIVKWDFYLW